MRNKTIILPILILLIYGSVFGQRAKKEKVIRGNICGNPTVKCITGDYQFAQNDIPFELPKGFIIYGSEYFYAVILKSQVVADLFGGEEGCKPAASEQERLATQELFPINKVFTQGCGYGEIYYTGIKENSVFMAVYGGKTLAQAEVFLKKVQAAGRFKGAFIKKMQAQFNGT